MSTCNCFQGTYSGSYKPRGTFESPHGIPIYQTTPDAGQKVKGALLYLPDAFGLAIHNLELADEYSKQGYHTTIVDYFQGDALPAVFMLYKPGTDVTKYGFTDKEVESIQSVNIKTWLQKHPPEKIASILKPFFANFRETIPEDTKLFVLGHCFGGPHAFQLAKGTEITASIVMHPSFLSGDQNKGLLQPTFVGLAESDVFTPNLITETLEAAKTWKGYYKISVYGGTIHGFASRADRSNEIALRNLRESFEDSIRFMALF